MCYIQGWWHLAKCSLVRNYNVFENTWDDCWRDPWSLWVQTGLAVFATGSFYQWFLMVKTTPCKQFLAKKWKNGKMVKTHSASLNKKLFKDYFTFYTFFQCLMVQVMSRLTIFGNILKIIDLLGSGYDYFSDLAYLCQIYKVFVLISVHTIEQYI